MYQYYICSKLEYKRSMTGILCSVVLVLSVQIEESRGAIVYQNISAGLTTVPTSQIPSNVEIIYLDNAII